MRVKVRFRFNSVTGEVEAFEVDDLREGPRLADHEARHDRAAADVARIIERNALIEEVAPGTAAVTTSVTRTQPETETAAAEPERTRE
jgi:FtsH ternary system domain X3